MYYWLQYTEQTEYYVISDQDDIVYRIDKNYFGETIAYKQKIDKYQLLRFMPYFKVIKKTANLEVEKINELSANEKI